MSLISGHKIFPVLGEEGKKLMDDMEGNRLGIIHLVPDNWFFPISFLDVAEKVYNFKVRPSDVAVVSYPKSGSTWIQEIIWTMMHNPNLDNPKAEQPMFFKVPLIEADAYFKYIFGKDSAFVHDFVKEFPGRNPDDGAFYQMTELSEDPRIFKTHLPFDLLPPFTLETCKVIYICRNPKDVIVSYYKFARVYKFLGFLGTLDSIVDHFINDNLIPGPYWSHLKQAWDKRDHPNLHFVFYEDLNLNPKPEITKIKNFFGLDLTEEQIDKIVDYTSFTIMKKRGITFIQDENSKEFMNHENFKEDGGFMNKGKVGAWKEKLTEEQARKIDKWSMKNVVRLEGDFKYKNNFF